MKRGIMRLAGVAVLCAITAGAAWAEDKPAAKAETAGRVYAPYSKLTLSADQKKQIAAVQADYRAKIRALEAEERQKVEALLNDDQKKELAKMAQEVKEHRAELSKEYRERKKQERMKEKEQAAAAGDKK